MWPFKLLMIALLLSVTLSGFSQDTFTKKQLNLHRKYDNYYNFYVNSKEGVLSYSEWLKKENLEDISGVDYKPKSGICIN